MAAGEDIARALAEAKEILDRIGGDLEDISIGPKMNIERALKSIIQKAKSLKDKLEPRPWTHLGPGEMSRIRGNLIESVVRRFQAQEEEEVPIRVAIADNMYSMKVLNGDEWTLFKNGEPVYSTSDNIGPYALAELFLAMMQDWARIEESDGRENPGDLIDKIIFEVIGASLAQADTVINAESNDKLKEIIEDITGREWDVREA